MYWWNIERLTSELREGEPSTRDQVGYVAATLLFPMLLAAGRTSSPATWPGALDWTGRVLAFLIVGTGIHVAYRANGGPTGRAFIARFVALRWVVQLRLTVLLFLPLTAVSVLALGWLPRQAWLQSAVLAFPGYMLDAILYLAVARRLRDVAGRRDAPMERMARAG